MTSLKYKNKTKTFFDHLYILVLLLYAGRSTTFFRSIETWENLFSLAFILIITYCNAIYNKIGFSKSFINLIVGYVIYFLLSTLKFKEFHPHFFGIYLLGFYLTYITIKTYRFRFYILYEKLLVFLCKFSLLFWVILCISPANFSSFMDFFEFSEPGAENVGSNIIVYTTSHIETLEKNIIDFNGISIYRNCGFSWEPGGFAVLINLGIFINMIRYRFRIKNNKNIRILLLALITTFSTTGYGILMILVLFYFYNIRIKYKGLLFPLFIALGIYLLSLPFMLDKVISVSGNDIDAEVESSILYGGHKTPQRINSFIIDFQDFTNNPILGYGGHLDERWTSKLGADISTISGIGKVFAVFGLVGVIFFFTLLYKSSKL